MDKEQREKNPVTREPCFLKTPGIWARGNELTGSIIASLESMLICWFYDSVDLLRSQSETCLDRIQRNCVLALNRVFVSRNRGGSRVFTIWSRSNRICKRGTPI